VIVPHLYDQHYFAERIDQLGAGVAHASATPTVDSLVAALRRVLQSEAAGRAKSLATAVRRDGAAIAAKHVTG
jgi:vancomycin aglycone glucosyltransferase